MGRRSLVEDEQPLSLDARAFGKLFFNILDYTGTATEKLADPKFDGEPTAETVTEVDADGEVVTSEGEENHPPETADEPEGDTPPGRLPPDEEPGESRKYYVDGGAVEVVAHLVYELDTDGKRLTCKKLTDWTGEKVSCGLAQCKQAPGRGRSACRARHRP